jgi:alkanesulfonate monooxygenase SsuD/methylene tetrahydromethanopterin reductase-like flavin-dependent oxidoreductase (luciferase family)
LSTALLIAPLRPAPLLARTVATLDQVSGGRLQLGVGTGWQEEELTSHGIDPAQRGRMLTDTMRACRALWAPGAASFTSGKVTFEGIWCEPKPFRPTIGLAPYVRDVDAISAFFEARTSACAVVA